MSDPHDDLYYEDTGECPDCGGEGGYPSCCEDTCPAEFGEENCDDPACWRQCTTCRGTGFLS